jgi:protein TonB
MLQKTVSWSGMALLVWCLTSTEMIGAPGGKKKQKPLPAAEIFKLCSPAIASLDIFDENHKPLGTATGFIVTPEGRIITNQHVIQNARYMAVRLTNGDVYDSVDVVETDLRRDIAILKIKAIKLPVLEMGDSDEVETGEQVYSIGNATGLSNTLQQGVVSGIRQIDGSRWLQIAASINPGNSGSPILNDHGQVVGIAKGRKDAENIGFAIPINYARGLMESKAQVSLALYYMINKRPANTSSPGIGSGPGQMVGGVPGGVAGRTASAAPGSATGTPASAAPFTPQATRQQQDMILSKIGSWTIDDAKLELGPPLKEEETPNTRVAKALEYAMPGTIYGSVTLWFNNTSKKLFNATFYYSPRPTWQNVMDSLKAETGCAEFIERKVSTHMQYWCRTQAVSFYVLPDGTIERRIHTRSPAASTVPGGVLGGVIASVPAVTPPPPPPVRTGEKPATPQRIRVGGNVQGANLTHHVSPVYPPLAKQARVQGTVRFTAIIGKDGTVQNLQLLSGHPLLVPAAEEAVKQWQYKPTLMNGEPVEVVTQIDVNFTLSQ